MFIGQIIDHLDAISSQVKRRCQLKQYDLNVVLENFFRDVLNLTYGLNLRNLNMDRANTPGLDLGDATAGARVAYQVTSQANAQKVKKTLQKISAEDAAKYDVVNVLIIGERQGSYTLDAALSTKFNFSTKNIVGMTELCRDIMDLDYETLQAVHRKIADEQRAIRIELEPVMPDGSFETGIAQFVEGMPSVRRSDASIFYAHEDVGDLFDDRQEAADALDDFIGKLSRLPRITREFYGWMVDEGEIASGLGSSGMRINADYVAEKCKNFPDFHATVRLLRAKDFIDHEEGERNESGHFSIGFPTDQRANFDDALAYFLQGTGLRAATLFSTMNFAPFGPEPAPTAKKSGPAKEKAKKKKPGKKLSGLSMAMGVKR